MAYYFDKTRQIKCQRCIHCGQKVSLLDDRKCLSLFLSDPAVKQHGFQCMNCGHVICFQCSGRRGRCVCGSNAWVAVPCLKGLPFTPGAQPAVLAG